MIAKPFYLLKKILFTTNLKQPHQTIKVKTPFFYSYPHSNNLISFKTALLQTNLKKKSFLQQI
ncbi:hypothetical protein DD778_07205 [Helicobacter pylori]|nr:hypothetical protein DD778_07205 [Helicobacter pylori]